MQLNPLITTENLSVVYNQGKPNENRSLHNVNIVINPEEFVILFGPSGCGKSTLLYSLLGIQPPTTGRVLVNGQDIALWGEEQRVNMTANFYGIIFQKFNLIFSLNVFDNIILPQIFMNKSVAERRLKAAELVKRFGIETRVSQMPNVLSGGQQQRVAICRALINEPAVLLADEPVGNLDSDSAETVMHTLSEINERDKKTIILVTHDPKYLNLAHRVYYMKDGLVERCEVRRALGRAVTSYDKLSLSTITELENLAHIHPNVSVEALKAWSLTSYLTEEFTAKQLDRLQINLERLLSGRLSQNEFFENLDKAYSEGGVGLYRPTAIAYARRVVRLLNEVGELMNNKGALVTDVGRQILTEHLRRWLLEDTDITLDREQLGHLEWLLNARLASQITTDEFRSHLDKSRAEGGIGLNTKTADWLANRLELILVQMV